MPSRIGDDTDDYCTHCHRLTNHTVAALVNGATASVTCRTCGFQHAYKHARVPARSAASRASAFDQVLAGILGAQVPPPAVPAGRGRKKSPRNK